MIVQTGSNLPLYRKAEDKKTENAPEPLAETPVDSTTEKPPVAQAVSTNAGNTESAEPSEQGLPQGGLDPKTQFLVAQGRNKAGNTGSASGSSTASDSSGTNNPDGELDVWIIDDFVAEEDTPNPNGANTPGTTSEPGEANKPGTANDPNGVNGKPALSIDNTVAYEKDGVQYALPEGYEIVSTENGKVQAAPKDGNKDAVIDIYSKQEGDKTQFTYYRAGHGEDGPLYTTDSYKGDGNLYVAGADKPTAVPDASTNDPNGVNGKPALSIDNTVAYEKDGVQYALPEGYEIVSTENGKVQAAPKDGNKDAVIDIYSKQEGDKTQFTYYRAGHGEDGPLYTTDSYKGDGNLYVAGADKPTAVPDASQASEASGATGGKVADMEKAAGKDKPDGTLTKADLAKISTPEAQEMMRNFDKYAKDGKITPESYDAAVKAGSQAYTTETKTDSDGIEHTIFTYNSEAPVFSATAQKGYKLDQTRDPNTGQTYATLYDEKGNKVPIQDVEGGELFTDAFKAPDSAEATTVKNPQGSEGWTQTNYKLPDGSQAESWRNPETGQTQVNVKDKDGNYVGYRQYDQNGNILIDALPPGYMNDGLQGDASDPASVNNTGVATDGSADGQGYFNHGETVAGIVESGGVVPNLAGNVKVHKINVDSGNPANREQDISDALDQAIAAAKNDPDSIDVVNLSQGALGVNGGTEAVQNKIKELEALGIPVIVAAGNNGQIYDQTTDPQAVEQYIGNYETFLAENPNSQADPDYIQYRQTGDPAALERFIEKNKLADDNGIVVESVADNGQNRADSGTGNVRVNAPDKGSTDGRQTSFAAPQLAPLVASWKAQGMTVDQIKAKLKEDAAANGGYFQGTPVENIFTELGLNTSEETASGSGTFG